VSVLSTEYRNAGLNACHCSRRRNPLVFQTDSLQNLDANRLLVIQEGGKILKSDALRGLEHFHFYSAQSVSAKCVFS